MSKTITKTRVRSVTVTAPPKGIAVAKIKTLAESEQKLRGLLNGTLKTTREVAEEVRYIHQHKTYTQGKQRSAGYTTIEEWAYDFAGWTRQRVMEYVHFAELLERPEMQALDDISMKAAKALFPQRKAPRLAATVQTITAELPTPKDRSPNNIQKVVKGEPLGGKPTVNSGGGAKNEATKGRETDAEALEAYEAAPTANKLLRKALSTDSEAERHSLVDKVCAIMAKHNLKLTKDVIVEA